MFTDDLYILLTATTEYRNDERNDRDDDRDDHGDDIEPATISTISSSALIISIIGITLGLPTLFAVVLILYCTQVR